MNQRTSDNSPRSTLIAVLLWFGAFMAVFFSFQLPNFSQPEAAYTRLDIWRQVPWALLDLIDPPLQMPAVISSWANLVDRLGQRRRRRRRLSTLRRLAGLFFHLEVGSAHE